MPFVFTPWMIVNLVFFGMVRVLHLYILTTSTFDGPGLDGEPGTRFGIAGTGTFGDGALPHLMLLSAGLLFFATVLGEMTETDPGYLWDLPSRVVCSISFSGLTLLYTSMAYFTFWAMG